MVNYGLKDKVVVITGATRGIGKAIAEQFLYHGAQVIGTGTKIEENRKDNFTLFQLDLNDQNSINTFVEYLNKQKTIDVLINNAGINVLSEITQIEQKDWDDIININLTGPMKLCKEVAKVMKKNKKGHILNMGSIWGIIGKEKRNAYAAAKTGLIGLTRAMAIDLGGYNILVNILCPGFTMTELTQATLSPVEIKDLSLQVPLGRFAAVEEIALTAIFLCSQMNTYITGQEIIVDGGFTVR